MAMSRQSWSINALSVEFQLDRRTVGKRLENVLPYDLGPDGSPRWRLSEAAPALLRPADKPAASKMAGKCPPGCEILLRVPDPAHGGWVIAWLELFANFQWLAAGPMMASGLSREQAEKTAGWLFVMLMSFADSSAKKAGIPPWLEEEEPGWLPSEMIVEPDWEAATAYAHQVQAEQAASPAAWQPS
ncbi:hypothetical protein [Geminicoccus flavidas]|uniref:hypothetical protein n=1 Tax=Geminicoccus flavidas TaxID=2506407 RepID=UPI00135B65A2|nr:hypothetical protein [Geminicoccus flavidas]